jgi:MFS family permease
MITSDSLLRNRDFQLLAVGQGLSVLGSSAAAITLPLLVFTVTRSPLRVGLVEAVWTGSVAIAYLAAGPIADRFRRRAIMLWCEYGRTAASAALAAAIMAGRTSMPVLLAAGVVLGLLTAPFATVGFASVRAIVPDDKLTDALAVNNVRNQVAGLLGPLLGGFLFTLGPSLPYWLNTASFAISVVSVHALRTPLGGVGGREAGWRKAFVEGIRFLWRDRVLRSVTVIAAAQNLVVDGISLTVVVGCTRLGMSSVSIGVLYDCWAIGALIGALAAPRLVDRVSRRSLLTASGAACSVAVPLMAASNGIVVLAPLLAGCASAVSLSSSVITLIRVTHTPDHLQGRAQGAVGLLLMGAPPLGSALAGVLIDHFSATVSFLSFAAVLVVLTVSAARTAPS